MEEPTDEVMSEDSEDDNSDETSIRLSARARRPRHCDRGLRTRDRENNTFERRLIATNSIFQNGQRTYALIVSQSCYRYPYPDASSSPRVHVDQR